MSNFDPQKVDELLREGIDAAKSGKKDIARSKFREVVAVEQNNEKAWFWLASVAETDDEKIFCLGNVTVINPDNERAKQMLEALLAKTASSQQPKVKKEKVKGEGGDSAKGPGGNQRVRLIALVIAIPIVLLLLVVVVLPRFGGAPSVPTVASINTVSPVAQTTTPTETTADATVVAAESSSTHAPTASRPTLPPSWTPIPSPTSASGVYATPLASPPPGLIGRLVAKSGIQRTSEDNLPLFVLSPDGATMKPVQVPTAGKDPDRGDYGLLSPDGQRIIFSRYLQGSGNKQMVIMTASGAQGRDVSFIWNNQPPLGNHQMLAMSRDGKILVFVAVNLSEGDGDPNIYYVPLTFNADGSLGPPPPTETAIPTKTPVSRPTLSRTAGATAAPTATPVPTATVGPTATFVPAKVTRVTAKGTGKNTWPTISPDDKTIVFAADTSSVGRSGSDLYSISLTGGTITNLTNDGTAYTEAAPEYSPDGKQIAFQAMKEGDNFNSLFVMDANGQNRKTLIEGDKKNDNIRPHWSPDGKYIAFSSNRSGKWEIFIVEIASGNLYQVTATAGLGYTVCTSWSKS